MKANPAPESAIADLDGPAAVPRKNGELVFAEPWEGRIFGLAVSLHDQRLYSWDEFRERLITEIGRADRQGEQSGYYERWLASFERLLLEKGLIDRGELEARAAEFAAGLRDLPPC